MIAFGSPTLKNHVLGYNLGIKVPKKVSEKVRVGIAASYGRLSPFGNNQITDFIDFTNLQVFIEYEKNNDAKVRPTFGFGLSNMARWSNGHNLVLLRKSRNDFSIRGGDFINVNAGLNYFFEENLYFKFLSDFLFYTKLFNKKNLENYDINIIRVGVGFTL